MPGRHEKRLDFLLGIPVHQSVAAGELSDLTAKLSGPQAHDGNHVAQAITLADCHDTLQHHKHARTGLPRREQAGTAFVATHVTEPADTRDLRLGQHRKHLMPPGRDYGRCIASHGELQPGILHVLDA